MQFCREICQNSDSLNTLHFEDTGFSGEDCDQFWSALADDDLCLDAKLIKLTIAREYDCFRDGRMESVEPLTRILSRNRTTLKMLDMYRNYLSAMQKQAIRDALTPSASLLIMAISEEAK